MCIRDRRKVSLVFIPERHLVAITAAGLVAFPPAHHDGGRIVAGRLPVNQPLVAAGQFTALHADGTQLVHLLGHAHQRAHAAERLTPEIGVGAGKDDPLPAVSQFGDHLHQSSVEELGLVYRHDVGVGPHLAEDFGGAVHRRCVQLATAMAGDAIEAGVPAIEVRLEYLDPPPGDDATANAADQFFALAAEHDAGNHFDPA